MKTIIKSSIVLLLILGALTGNCHLAVGQEKPKGSLRFPYRQAGLTAEQAAAHLLDRFSYGARPGEVEAVASEGLETWFLRQLDANMPEDTLNTLLANLDALQLSNEQVAQIFPSAGQVLRSAIKDGGIKADSGAIDRKAHRQELESYRQNHQLRPQQELFKQLIDQRIYRAAYSHNQLLEVMTAFWFNHFNVSLSKNSCARFVPAYERDVIRPNALGNFSDLLLATAKSPAMLFYLDNFSSTAAHQNKVLSQTKKRAKGINENYAREVMELHTLGVDGGYRQQDVTEAARVLTGWTVFPLNGKAQYSPKNGNIREGDFLFVAARHDKGKKTVLGKPFGPKPNHLSSWPSGRFAT
ncbi:hypothetical protein GCM10023231_01100 [Olivibacter ginsenosidimutans]|uniref:DUF1800 domain-containing protein n=1 Tax=Olivibacter ginsenosidimutans TaxID=1176537 RepID=A0ABP9AC65_9SPHI